MANFYLVVKSTIDKIAHDVATQLGIQAVELDDVTNVQQVCDTGVYRVAVSSGVVNASDPAQAADRMRGMLVAARRAAGGT